MKIIDTRNLSPEGSELNANEVYWVYNGLDCCLTAEIRNELSSRMDDSARATYAQHMRMQAPILEMMMRGCLINLSARDQVRKECEDKLARLEKNLKRLCVEGIGLPDTINATSPVQVKKLFYETLGLPVIKEKNAKGIMAPSSSREALEQLSEYFDGTPFSKLILAIRDMKKQIGFLKTPLDDDNKIRCNFNLAGTKTRRLSSSFSDMGTGTNLQNIARPMKRIFEADPGKVLVNIDLEQADSRNVGALCWNMFYESHGPEFAGSYLDACESADLHTTVTMMAWPEVLWPDDLKACRTIADEIFYREYSRRDLSKKLGHGSNYGVKPNAAAKHAKIMVRQAASFQKNYFDNFPCIPEWQKETVKQLMATGELTHLYGHRRYFFGRLDDQKVQNEAIAHCPQSMTGEQINLGLLALWRNPAFELLIQVHDSILFQIDQNRVNELVPLALELMKVRSILAGGREFYVPLDAEVGWNWGKFKEGSNPYGMKSWKGEELRTPPVRKKKLLNIRDYL